MAASTSSYDLFLLRSPNLRTKKTKTDRLTASSTNHTATPPPPSARQPPKSAPPTASSWPSVFLCLKPSGALLLRTLGGPSALRVHIRWQTTALLLALAGVGMGTWLAVVLNRYGHAHPTIGFVVAGLFVLQPILGWMHHVFFVRVRRGTWWGFTHVWNGRLLILLGCINGGLGLQAADNTVVGERVYGVIAVVSFSCYIGIVIMKAYQGRKASELGTAEESQPRERLNSFGASVIHK